MPPGKQLERSCTGNKGPTGSGDRGPWSSAAGPAVKPEKPRHRRGVAFVSLSGPLTAVKLQLRAPSCCSWVWWYCCASLGDNWIHCVKMCHFCFHPTCLWVSIRYSN